MPTLRSIPVPRTTHNASSEKSAPEKPSEAAVKSNSQDENKVDESPRKTFSFSLSPGSATKKIMRKKPRVTESLSPACLLLESPSSSKNSPSKKRKCKRTCPDSDTENNGDETNESKVATNTKRHKKYLEPIFGCDSPKTDDDDKSEDSKVLPRTIFSQDSLSDESSDDEDLDKKPKALKPSQLKKKRTNGARDDASSLTLRHKSNSRENEWITSHHASTHDESESDESSSESDEEEPFLREDWWKASARKEKLEYLDSFRNDNDKALQLLLWDVGFEYLIHPHQFEAIRFVAGFIPTFPFELDADDVDQDIVKDMLQIDSNGCYYRKKALDPKNARLQRSGRGMILADEMGLGKTIEALGGAALRNFPFNSSAKKKLPTLIVTPQDGVQDQWVQSLVNGGVEQARITIIGEKRCDRHARVGQSKARKQGGHFIICTRYKIMSEMKKLFDYSPTATQQKKTMPKSILFENVPQPLIKRLRQQYMIEQGKEQAPRNVNKKEKKQDRVTRIVASTPLMKKAFETVIIDEAHFLRNILAYWGLGASALGAQSKRTILLSGTPYNNSTSDLSSLMTYIDPKLPSAKLKWWENATKGRAGEIIRECSKWKSEYMLRRQKDVLGDKLPARDRVVVDAPLRLTECGVYEYYEYVFLKVLNQLQEEVDDGNRRKQREMVDMMMSCMACMRMSLIHPTLPKGREMTIQFSPSRNHLLHREERPKICIICDVGTPSENAAKHQAIKDGRDIDNDEELNFRQILGGVRSHSDENVMDNDDDLGWGDSFEDDGEKGKIVEIGEHLCRAAGSECCHFAHERCLQKLENETSIDTCPRCVDLSSRLHGTGATNVYCQEIQTAVSDSSGFAASAKIEKAVEWFNGVPKSDKAIILSFFKGSLDLLEGILTYEYGVRCSRYDGDVSKEKRAQDLHRFKTNKDCRVLLASVQSGGTGLNIVEANHILFLDRWFNPQIHDQAESRCHRLKQTKDVKIAYLDTSYSADNVMRHVNILKENNAGVILADGTSLGQIATINYNELAGVLGESLKAVIAMRVAAVGNPNAPLVFGADFDLESKLNDMIVTLKSKKNKKDSDDDSDNESSSTEKSSFRVKSEGKINAKNRVGKSLKTKSASLGDTFGSSDEDSSDEDSSDDDNDESMIPSKVTARESTSGCSSQLPRTNGASMSNSWEITEQTTNDATLDDTFHSSDNDSSDDEDLFGPPIFGTTSRNANNHEVSDKSILEENTTSSKTATRDLTRTPQHNESTNATVKTESAPVVNVGATNGNEVVDLCSSDDEDDRSQAATLAVRQSQLEDMIQQAVQDADWVMYELLHSELEKFRG